MALDPNIPLRMPQQQSFAEQTGQAFELASVVEKQRAMQQQRQDSANLQQYLKEGGNLDTPEGITKAMEWGKGKLSLPSYQTLVSAGHEMRKNEAQRVKALMETDVAKIDIANKKNSVFMQSANPVLTQYEEDKQKLGEQQASENFKSNWQKQVQNVAQLGVFTPQELQDAVTWTPQQTQSKLQSTEYGQKLLTEAMSRKKTAQDIQFSEAKEKRERELLPLEKRKLAAQASESEAKAQEARMGGGASAKALQARYGKPPRDYRWTETGELERIPGSAADTKFKIGMQADQTAVTGVEAAMDRLANAATELRDAPGLEGIAGIKGAIPDLPGSPAANAEALRRSLVAQVGFSVLQDMRNASKTGGALGNVSDAEGKRLEAALGNLERGGQSLKQLKNNIDKVIFYAVGAKQRMKSAFEKKYADENMAPAEQATAQPAAAAPSSDVLSILKKHGVK